MRKNIFILLGVFLALWASPAWSDGNYEKWDSTEITTVLGHYVFTSSPIYIDSIVVSTPGYDCSFAMYDSSTTLGLNDTVHIATISLSRESGVYAGQQIPVKRNFGGYDGTKYRGLLLNVRHGTTATRPRFRVLYRWISGADRTLGD